MAKEQPPRDLLMCRRVAKTLAHVFSPALLLQRLHLPPRPFNDVVDKVFALRYMVFTKLWSLKALQEVVPEHRLANARQHVAQGFVSMIYPSMGLYARVQLWGPCMP